MSHYPEVPGYKGDAPTGREAAEALAPTVSHRRAEVLDDLRRHGPSTADEIADRIGRHWYVVRPRVSELTKLGFAVATGDKRPTGLGGQTQVVRATTPEERAAFLATQEAEGRHG